MTNPMNRTTLLAAAAGLALGGLQAKADDRAWNSPFNGSYTVSANWAPATVPVAADRVIFDQSGSYTVSFNPLANTTNSQLVVRNDNVVFDLKGKTYTVTSGANTGFSIGGGGGHGSSGDVGQLTIATSTGTGVMNTVMASIGGTAGVLGSGKLTVSNTLWNNSSIIFVGSSSPGELIVKFGGDVTAFASVIGETRPGVATVTDTGSTWIHSSSLDVGGNATGTLNVQNGGLVRDTEALIGGGTGITGIATVTGVNSRWENNGPFSIGLNGSGSLTVSAGGFVSGGGGVNQCTIGDSTTGSGSLTVTGANSRMNFTSGPTHFGRLGAATININSGGRLDHNSDAYLSSILGTCNATITGIGSRWIPGAGMYVGGTSGAPGGTATLTLSNNGLLQIGSGSTLKIWNGSTVNLSGGIIQTGTFSNSGTFNWTSGTLHLLSDFAIGTSGPLGNAPVIGTGKVLQAANVSINGNAATALSVPGGTVISDYGFIVGSSGQGAASITANGQLSSRGLIIGQSASANGSVVADGAGTHLNLGEFPDNQDMHVGKGGTGLLTISNAALATVAYNIFNIGNDTGSLGTVRITGAASQLSLAEYYLSVGRFGTGTLEVLSGGRLNGSALIAENTGASGTVKVAGAGSTWTASAITVGNGGAGTLSIESGAAVTTGDFATTPLSGSNAQVTLTGQGSSLTATPGTNVYGQIIIGGADVATMLIDQGASAQCAESFIGDGSTSTGTMTVRGTGTTFNATDELAVAYNGRGTLNVESGAHVSTGALFVGALNAANGDATVTGSGSLLSATNMTIGGGQAGRLTIANSALAQAIGAVTIQPTGSAILSGGTLTALAVNLSGGALKGSGVAIAPVSNAGTVSPGASAGLLTVQGTYSQSAAGALKIELGGTTSGMQYDRLAISGAATLNGTLNVSFIDGYLPRGTEVFTILTASSISGTFSTVNLPSVPGGSLKLIYSPTSVSIAFCYANCDGSSAAPTLNANDFQCYLNKFAANNPYANCDGSTATPTLNANDFQCFLNKFAAGCT